MAKERIICYLLLAVNFESAWAGVWCECGNHYNYAAMSELDKRMAPDIPEVRDCNVAEETRHNTTHCYSRQGECYRELKYKPFKASDMDTPAHLLKDCDYRVKLREYGCVQFEEDDIEYSILCQRTSNKDYETICCKGENCNTEFMLGTGIMEAFIQTCLGNKFHIFWLVPTVVILVMVSIAGAFVLLMPQVCKKIIHRSKQVFDTEKGKFDGSGCDRNRHHDLLHDFQSQNTTVSHAPSSIYNSSAILNDLNDSEKGAAVLVQRTISRQINILELKGNGRYGEVYHGKWQGSDVAVKKFHAWDDQSWQHEYEIYNSMTHQNILGFIAADNKDNGLWTELWLVTEYHERGSIFDFLNVQTVTPLEAVKMLFTAVNGLEHIHKEIVGTSGKQAVAHRDIKAKNIMVKNNGECCIGDMGLAICDDYLKKLKLKNEKPNVQVGTKRYMAPEVLQNTIDARQFNNFKRADIYSMALVIWEVLRRTQITPDHVCDEYQLPYYEHAGNDPKIVQMEIVVAQYVTRPEFNDLIYENRPLHQVTLLVEECWMNEPSGRLPTLRLKKSLQVIYDDLRKSESQK